MSGAANDRRQGDKSLPSINDGLKVRTVKALPTVIVSWGKTITRLGDLYRNAVHCSKAADKRVSMLYLESENSCDKASSF
jgi:hypothetical protein